MVCAIASHFYVTRVELMGNTMTKVVVIGDWSSALYGTWCIAHNAGKVRWCDGAIRETWESDAAAAIGGTSVRGERATIMSYNVMPLKKHAEITYRVKCVAVENERVFGDVYVTQQTQDLVYRPEGYPFPPECKRQRRNLIQQTLDGPDFMELNSKRSTGSAGVASSRWQKRSKSMGDEPSVVAFNYRNTGNHATAIKRPKVNVRTMPFMINRSPSRGFVS